MTFEEIEDKNRYFIQPYVEGRYVKIEMSEQGNVVSIRSYDENSRRQKIDNKIRKELTKSYRESKFFKFPIVLEGVLSVDKKNRTFLVLYDIFLKDEYEGKQQSKRYGIRHENLIFRFLSKTSKLCKAVFSHEYNDVSIQLVVDQFIKTDSLDRIVFRKNVPKDYEENDIIEYDIWQNMTGQILDYETAEGTKKEFDENQKLISETPFEYLKSFKIFCNEENEVIIVELSNFTESDKVKFLNEAKDFIGRNCKFKKYNFLNNVGYVFGEAEQV